MKDESIWGGEMDSQGLKKVNEKVFESLADGVRKDRYYLFGKLWHVEELVKLESR